MTQFNFMKLLKIGETDMTKQINYIILDNETFTPITSKAEDIVFSAETLIEVANEMIDDCNRDAFTDEVAMEHVKTVQQAMVTFKDFGYTAFVSNMNELKTNKEVLKNMLQHDKCFYIRFCRHSSIEIATVEPLAVVDDNLTFQVYKNADDTTIEYVTAPLYIAGDLITVIQLLVQAHYSQPVKQVYINKL